MVIGGVLPSYAVICRSPELISHSFLPATRPTCSPNRRCLNKLVSVRARGFKFREEAERDGYVGGGTFGGSRSREKRSWWTDGSAEEDFDDEEYEFEDEEPESIWDKIWIFKVFKAYGYFLPAIIASMLLATGPKAFLMALALPLGQSALSLVFEKVFGKDNERAKHRSKAKKWASGRSRYGSRRKAVQEEQGGPDPDYKANKSWMAADADVSRQNGPQQPLDGYGGWDELDRREFSKAKMRSAGSPTHAQHPKKERLTRRGRSKDMPLFWRMLVAVFPFLGSLTKLL